MRIISQDGKYDVAYERVSFRREGTNIYMSSTEHSNLRIAEYSIPEKAIKAMEMCRKQYAVLECNRRIIPKGNVLVDMEIAKELLASGFIFQFPAEEEVEV